MAHRMPATSGFWSWVKENILRLHTWADNGGYTADGGVFTRQRCLKCPKTRVNRFFERDSSWLN